MTNTFSTIKSAGIIAKAAAAMFEDEPIFCKSISKADESDYNGKNGYGAGDTIYINQPPRYVAGSSFDITSAIQGSVETKVPLVLDVISTIAIDADSLEFASEIEIKNYFNRAIKPAVSSMVQDVENKMLGKATKAVFNSVGTAGSTIADTDTVLAAKERMSKYLCPKDSDRYLLVDSTSQRKAVNARKGLFNDQTSLASQYKNGAIGKADGFNWIENELLYNHTNGNDVVFEVRTTVATEGQSTLVVEGLTANTGTVKAGTSFTIAGRFAVHPITKETYPFLQQFVVTADATADASGYATLSVSPAFYTSASGGLQNISSFPVDGDVITPVGAASTSYTQSLAFHKQAFRMVSVPLIMPTKAEFAVQETHKGMTVAIIRDWDQLKRRMITRLDFLGGIVAERPEWACKVTA